MLDFQRGRFLLGTVAVIAVCFFASCSSGSKEQDKIKIKFSHVAAVDTPKGKAAQFFKEELEKLSKGQIEVLVYPNSQLFRDNDAITALLMGSVQIISPSTSKMTTMVPEFQVVDLPYLFPSIDNVHKSFDGMLGTLFGALLEQKNFKLLAYWDGGYKQLGNSRRVIRKLSDIKGLKFRIMSSKVLEAQFRHVGGNPQVLPFSEVYTALEQGVIDGQENTWFNSYSQKFFEVQKYITETNHGYLGYLLLTSQKFWDSLPPDLQAVLSEAAEKTTEYERKLAVEIDTRDRQRIIDSGKTEITVLTAEERDIWMKTFREIYGDYPQWKELIDAALNH